MATEELLQCLRIHLERRVLSNVAVDDGDEVGGDVLGFVPVLLEPVLKLRDLLGALDLDVELDVLRQARSREVR